MLAWPADELWFWVLILAGVFFFRALFFGAGYTIPLRRKSIWITALALTVLVTAGAPAVLTYVIGVNTGAAPLGVYACSSFGFCIGASGATLGAWALYSDRARGRRRCPVCWYDMSGTPRRACPECGHEAAIERRLFRTRRRPRWAIAAVALLLLAGATTFVPQVISGSWIKSVPTTALIVALPWLDSNALQPIAEELLARIRSPEADGTLATWPSWQRSLLLSRCRVMIESPAGLVQLQYVGAIIGLSGPDSRDLFPAVSRLANDPKPNFRAAALGILAGLDLPPDQSRPRLIAALSDGDAGVVRSAMFGLGQIGAQHPGTVASPELLAVCRATTHIPTRRIVPEIMTYFVPTAETRAILVNAVGDPDVATSASAVVCLLRLDPRDPAAIAKLISGLESGIPVDIERAANTLFTWYWQTGREAPVDRSPFTPEVNAALLSAASSPGLPAGSTVLGVATVVQVPLDQRIRILEAASARPAQHQYVLGYARMLGLDALPLVPRLEAMRDSLPESAPLRREIDEFIKWLGRQGRGGEPTH